MTNNELEILTYITKIINAAQSDDAELVKSIVEEINDKDYGQSDLGTIEDAIFEDMHNQCSQLHLYCLENINNLPDQAASIRIGHALVALNLDPESKRKFLENEVCEDRILSGHKTDFYFCSILIRLCLSIQAFDLISMIQEILNKNKVSGEV